MCGTEVQASAVRQRIELFSVPQTPGTEFPDFLKIAVQLSPHVIPVKPLCKVVHSLRGADLHIDRGTAFQIRKIPFQEFCDDRRRCGNRRQNSFRFQKINEIADFLKKNTGETFPSVTMSVQKKAACNTFAAETGEPGQERILHLIFHQRVPISGRTASGGDARPGEIDLLNPVLVLQDERDEIFSGLHRISRHETHDAF